MKVIVTLQMQHADGESFELQHEFEVPSAVIIERMQLSFDAEHPLANYPVQLWLRDPFL